MRESWLIDVSMLRRNCTDDLDHDTVEHSFKVNHDDLNPLKNRRGNASPSLLINILMPFCKIMP